MMNPYLIRNQNNRSYQRRYQVHNSEEFKYDKQVEDIYKVDSELKFFESKITKLERTKQIGSSRWQDAVHFDDFEKIPNLLDYKIHKIKIFYGVAFSPKPPSINGIEVTYKHLLRDEYITTGENKGDKDLTGSQEFELSRDQFITNVHLRHGWIMDSLTFNVHNKGEITIGGQGGSFKDFELQNRVVVGFHGTYGTNLYSIGLYTISEEDYRNNLFMKEKFIYVALRHRLHNNPEQIQAIIKSLEIREDKINYLSDIVFGKLCLLSKHVLADVVRFIN
jgi:hypothetical protein